MTSHVLEEDPYGPTLRDDAGDVGPQVPLVVGSLSLSCGAERLAGISCENGVDRAPEGLGVERGEVVPDGGGGEVSGPLGGDDGLPRVWLPFDKATGVEAGLCEHKAQIKATGSGAEAEPMSGTWHHTVAS